MKSLWSTLWRRPLTREVLIFTVFLLLTALMTWPWVLHLRDAVPDPGDPYAISYFLWWDFHQTFHDPLNLFQATIFYPYHYSLAFGEFDYGVSILFFPLFAIGLRPLTVFTIASFLSFPFTAYGTFRLARTLSGSINIAWIAGISLTFLPFRFHHLSHLHLIFAGWIPLLFEALVRFARNRSWRGAIWLGFAFLMNALTCTTWLLLTIIPLACSAAILLSRNSAWRDRNFWLRSGATLGIAGLLLLPFLLPLRRVSMEHQFIRSPDEVSQYSATPMNWLAVDERNRVWSGFGAAASRTEMVLFPGLLVPMLAISAFFFPGRGRKFDSEEPEPHRNLMLLALDFVAVGGLVIAVMSIGYGVLRLRLFGHVLMTVSSPGRAVAIAMMAIFIRCLIAYPRVLRNSLGDRNLLASFSSPHSEVFGHALVWIGIGFAGSFGLNFAFHRFLYENVQVFRGMRVATRWAMICYVGLALLAGLGTSRLAKVIEARWPRIRPPLIYGVIFVAILFELHAAPLKMIRGAADPDALTMDLKSRKMSGGILELPTADGIDHLYMLRAADHMHPLVNGRYSYVPPLLNEIEQLASNRPIPPRLFDVLERIPVSYVTVHHESLSPGDNQALEEFMKAGIAGGRIRFIKSFPAKPVDGIEQHDDLYAVTKTEPNARSETR